MTGPPAFPLPVLTDTPDGWGPAGPPPELEGIPFAPYSKGERVGRAADFTPAAAAYARGECEGRGGCGEGGPRRAHAR